MTWPPLIATRAFDAGRTSRRAVPRSLSLTGVAAANIAFAGFLCAIALVRWTIFQPLPLPSGADGGNWLALGRALGHPAAMPGGVIYPPLVPALALAADLLGKPIAGLKLIAAVSSVVPALGCYAGARIGGLGWTAAIACAFLAVAGSVGEAAAWGGYPQLLALGFLPMALVLLDRSLRGWQPGMAVLAGISFGGTLAANEMVGAVAVLAALLLVGIHLVLLGSRPPTLKRLLVIAVLTVAPSLLLVPVYAPLLVAVYATRGTAPVYANVAVGGLLPHVYGDLPAFWYTAQLLALPAACLLTERAARIRRIFGAEAPHLGAQRLPSPVPHPPVHLLDRRCRTWPPVLAMLASAATLCVGLQQFRFGYVLPVTAVMALATWVDGLAGSWTRMLRTAAPVLAVGLVPVLAYESIADINLFRTQVRFYQVVPADWVHAMRFLRDDTAAGSLVAVGPGDRAGYPTGWWVQGLGERPALISSDPAWLYFPGERSRAREALQIFDPSISAAESVRRARARGVAYLLVDKRWSHYQAWRGSDTGIQVVVDDADVAVLRV